MTLGLVIASVIGTLWGWLVWIVIGGVAGAIADRLVLGNRFGCLGNVVIGIVGGLVGGFLLGLFGIGTQGIILTFVTALVGAIILLWVVNAVMGGRAKRL